MPEHNALTYYPWLTAATARMFGLPEHGDGVTRVSESLYPIADLWSRPDWLFTLGILRWAVFLQQGAVIGEFSQIGIQNPLTSNSIIVIESFEPVNIGAGIFAEERLAASSVGALTATGSPTQLDSRIPGVATPSGVQAVSFANHNAARRGTLLRSHSYIGTTQEPFPLPALAVLGPGGEYAVGASIVNTAINCNLTGWERKALPGELIRA